MPPVTAEFYINKQTACHPERQAVPAPNSRPHTVRYANAHRESIRLCVILSGVEIFVGEARRAEKIEERQRRRDLVTSLVGLSRCCYIFVFTTLQSPIGDSSASRQRRSRRGLPPPFRTGEPWSCFAFGGGSATQEHHKIQQDSVSS